MSFPNAHDHSITLEWLAIRLKEIATCRRLIKDSQEKHDADIAKLREKLRAAEALLKKELDGSQGVRERIRTMIEEIISE